LQREVENMSRPHPRQECRCTHESTAALCRYLRYNGATWLPDEAFSDVVSPLPGQPDSSIVTEYAGDYDYSFGGANQHVHTWTDGRVAIGGSAQQDAFVDQEGAGGGNPITLQTRVQTQGTKHKVQLKWSPADGGSINVIRDGVTVGTTADDGNAADNLGTRLGTFVYQVCETDTGDCSNEVTVVVQ